MYSGYHCAWGNYLLALIAGIMPKNAPQRNALYWFLNKEVMPNLQNVGHRVSFQEALAVGLPKWKVLKFLNVL